MVRQFETELKNLNQAVNRNENSTNQRSNMIIMKQNQLDKYKKTITEVIFYINFFYALIEQLLRKLNLYLLAFKILR